MHTKSLIKHLLKISKIVVEEVYFDQIIAEEIVVIRARPYSREQQRCPHCGKGCKGYDSSEKTRRWRSLDLGSERVYIEAASPRVKCLEHGVVVAKVPWARHNSDYTYDFETAVTWLSLHATAQDVTEYFRIDWHTVGSIARRVQESLEKELPSRFEGLEEIGIDETSYKKGHKYMTVVIDHKSGNLIWAKKGHGKEVLAEFFEELTAEQCAGIKYVTADGAGWIKDCVGKYCPSAERCIDPFHVVAWANDSLDIVRRASAKRAREEAAAGKTADSAKKKTDPKY